MPDRFPCPCCGHLVFSREPGSYDLCPVCFWEDDGLQLAFPTLAGGANQVCLCDAQRHFVLHGASEPQFIENVRAARSDEALDPEWREFDLVTDPYLNWDLPEHAQLWKDVPPDAELYYWRPGYWLLSRIT